MSKQSPTCIPCDIRSFRRNTYFNGKLLVERDFEAEQAYLVGKDWLHNNLLHGAGTVCGLKVLAHDNPECRDSFVYITPGVAVDCCGREIIVEHKHPVNILKLIGEQDVDVDTDGSYDLFISLCYKESLEEKIPVILPDCDCADANQAYNRICEGYQVRLFSQDATERLPERPPLCARLDWDHTLTLAEQSPRALAVDEHYQQLYVAAQALLAEDDDPDVELGARLYAFRMDNHDLITAIEVGKEPTDLALSLLGSLIFLATSGLSSDTNDDITGIAVFEEADIRGSTVTAAIIDLGEPARLVVSPHTGALFALLLNSGRLIRWSEDAIRAWVDLTDPPTAGPDGRKTLELGNSFDHLNGATMLNMTLDGRYLFIADAANDRVRVVDVAHFAEVDQAITSEGRPLALAASRDSAYLYVLWDGQGNDEGNAILTRYELNETTGQLHRNGRRGIWPTRPHDLAIAPDERWAYVLQSDSERQGQVQAIAIEEIGRSEIGHPDADLENLLGTRANVSGFVRYERLTVMGGRLCVAADDEQTGEPEKRRPERGLVAILDVEEAACDNVFIEALDDCPTCQDGDPAGNCVVLAHIPHYRHEELILDPTDATTDDDNVIDNLTYRSLVPSTNNITRVIRCMLEQGIAEGVPGPRGLEGEQGLQGPRGPGIVTARIEDQDPPGPGDAPTVRLDPDPAAEPDADKTLILGIPPGPQGPGIVAVEMEDPRPSPGDPPTVRLDPDPAIDPDVDKTLILGIPRGPGINAVSLTTDSGQKASARLDPDPDVEPDVDKTLVLNIPPDEQDLTYIDRLSWEHDQILQVKDFINLAVDPDALNQDMFGDPGASHPPGLVISFNDKVDTQTIFTVVEPETGEPPLFTYSQVFQLYVRHQVGDSPRRFCECVVPDVICQPVIVAPDGPITTVITLDPREPEALAVRIVFDNEDTLKNILDELAVFQPALQRTEVFFRVVLRSDFVLDIHGKAIDGNHLGGSLRSGNGRQGGTFESWFTVTL